MISTLFGRIFTVGLLLFLFLISGITHSLKAQESCTQTLNRAEDSFDAGKLYGIPAILKPCLDNGFTKEQRIQAYWLLTRTYLFIDDPISAEDSYLKLLKLDPEYEIDRENDPIDVIYLSEKFTTTPIFSIIVGRVGGSFTNTTAINNYGTDNTGRSLEDYKSGFGFQAGSGVALNFSDRVSLVFEATVATRKYSYSNTLFDADLQEFTENQVWVDLPIYLSYTGFYKKFEPYVYGGFAINYLLTSNGNFRLVNSTASDNPSEPPFTAEITGPDIGLKDLRQSINRSLVVGAGLKRRIGYNYVFLDMRYQKGLTNIVDPVGQYSNNELLFRYAYVDDDFKVNNLSFSFGFIKPLYKPRKTKEVTIRTVMKDLFNKKKQQEEE